MAMTMAAARSAVLAAERHAVAIRGRRKAAQAALATAKDLAAEVAREISLRKQELEALGPALSEAEERLAAAKAALDEADIYRKAGAILAAQREAAA